MVLIGDGAQDRRVPRNHREADADQVVEQTCLPINFDLALDAEQTSPWSVGAPQSRPQARRRRRRPITRLRLSGNHIAVTLSRSFKIGDANHFPKLDGESNELLDMAAAFGPVAVDKISGGYAAQNCVQAPCEGHAVAHAAAQALPGKGRHQVGRIAGEQRPAYAPPLSPLAAERVDCMALEIRCFRRHSPRRQQPPGDVGAIHLRDLLAGQPHEFPTPPSWAARHDRGRPSRVAGLLKSWESTRASSGASRQRPASRRRSPSRAPRRPGPFGQKNSRRPRR